MNKPVEISNSEWAEVTRQVSENKEQIGYLKGKGNRHSKRLDDLEDNNLTLSLTIKEAIESSMSPIMDEIASLHRIVSGQKDKINELENSKYKNAYESMVKIAWAFATVFITGLAAIAFKFFFG